MELTSAVPPGGRPKGRGLFVRYMARRGQLLISQCRVNQRWPRRTAFAGDRSPGCLAVRRVAGGAAGDVRRVAGGAAGAGLGAALAGDNAVGYCYAPDQCPYTDYNPPRSVNPARYPGAGALAGGDVGHMSVIASRLHRASRAAAVGRLRPGGQEARRPGGQEARRLRGRRARLDMPRGQSGPA
jgi:hypothetical protein